jgi:hypothetical protein
MQRLLTSVFWTALAAAGLVFVQVAGAAALDYPTRSPRIIVGYPAGGSTDIVARSVPVIIDRNGGSRRLHADAQPGRCPQLQIRRPCALHAREHLCRAGAAAYPWHRVMKLDTQIAQQKARVAKRRA